ncbi:MAG: hypothetical protein HW421_1403 [Ignavibacteria bacterium]|nr:hypothetical protein [Ignavibacteria bacterium]
MMRSLKKENIDYHGGSTGENDISSAYSPVIKLYSKTEKNIESKIFHWPVPESYSKFYPKPGEPGAFWEDREDRFHCGIDIYAAQGASVIAIESGKVIDIGVFTSPQQNEYWNITYYVIIKTSSNINYKYAELEDLTLRIGDYVDCGQELGHLGLVINRDKVKVNVPMYIREILGSLNLSMLHLELYKAPITEVRPYSGGNFFGKEKPESLLNPLAYLPEMKKGDKIIV